MASVALWSEPALTQTAPIERRGQNRKSTLSSSPGALAFLTFLRRYQVTGYNWICKTATQPMAKRVVSQNRSEGLRRFKLAGRPTTDQFVLVYGERGP